MKFLVGTIFIVIHIILPSWGIDFFDFAPRNFAKEIQDNRTSHIPGPSFFSNFQMPFMTFEEIMIKDNSTGYQNFPESVADDIPTNFFEELNTFAHRQPHFNMTNSKVYETDEFDDPSDPNRLFSVFRITVDGQTPFNEENESEIIYNKRGEPTEVVVYPDMETSDSKISVVKASPSSTIDKKQLERFESETDSDYYTHGEIEDVEPIVRSDHGYGHDDHGHGGYDDHHDSGYDDHHGGGYDDHHDHGYVPHKKPGPYGYGKPNYKCEYAKETLYVTKTDYKFKKKCYKILKVDCKSKYDVGKKIGYKKICNEFSVTKCRTAYITKFKTRCWLIYKKKCEDSYKTKVDWVYKEKCTTKYEKECSGYGYHKSCHEVPKEICKQVPEKVEKQIKSVKCKKVPDKKCKILKPKKKCKCKCKCRRCKCKKKDSPFFVPKKECKDFPTTVCTEDPINVKKNVPIKVCFTVPIEKCVKVPREVLKHVPKTVKKKVCVSTKSHDYHSGGGYGHDDHHDSGYGGYSSQHFHSASAKIQQVSKKKSPSYDYNVDYVEPVKVGFPSFKNFQVGNSAYRA